MDRGERLRIRQLQSISAADLLHAWLLTNRQKVPDGTATAKAIDYSLTRWAALTRFIDYADLAADNNRIENLIRPIAWAGRTGCSPQLARRPTGRSHHDLAALSSAQRA